MREYQKKNMQIKLFWYSRYWHIITTNRGISNNRNEPGHDVTIHLCSTGESFAGIANNVGYYLQQCGELKPYNVKIEYKDTHSSKFAIV